MDPLYNYVFHFNTYDKHWYAIPRDMYSAYWTNPHQEGILRSHYINPLIEEITKK